ncbi:MAG TPA: ABC transporter permease [Elusimicrobia bacterium]|nr:MAG: multidrug ABC transporter permease [Elusimicrobia bacterium GWF2_62_30]HBA62213.1 ABC transporter permease [Elusimicrobiota bacterium]
MKRTLLAFIRKELIQTLRDVRMRVLLFGAPVIQLTIFGLALSTEIKNINLAVISGPGDAMFGRVAEGFYASGWFKRVIYGSEAPFELIASGRADAVLIAPAGGLARSAARGDGRMQLLVDATNLTKARAVEAYARNIISAAAAREYGARAEPALKFDVRVLYNPAMESSMFLVPGVMGMLVCLITIILTAMSLAREREVGTFETIVSAPLSDAEVLLGKTVPYVLLGVMDAALVVAAGYLIFGVPVRGPLWQLALASLALVITTVSIGTFISTIARNQQQAMLGGFMFLFPAILMSGIMYPVENMPGAIIAAAYLDPLMYFVRLLRNIMLKGGDLHVLWTNLGALALMALVAAGAAYKRFKQTLN